MHLTISFLSRYFLFIECSPNWEKSPQPAEHKQKIVYHNTKVKAIDKISFWKLLTVFRTCVLTRLVRKCIFIVVFASPPCTLPTNPNKNITFFIQYSSKCLEQLLALDGLKLMAWMRTPLSIHLPTEAKTNRNLNFCLLHIGILRGRSMNSILILENIVGNLADSSDIIIAGNQKFCTE